MKIQKIKDFGYLTIQIADKKFRLEKCFNHERGLAGRSHLDPEEGMIFLYKNSQPLSFHMEGCNILLDIIFIQNNEIIKIYSNCQPCKTQKDCIKYTATADKVIELLGGSCIKYGIKEGNSIKKL